MDLKAIDPIGAAGIVLDSSAIVAVHLKEPGHDRLRAVMDRAGLVLVGVPTVLETAMVLTTRLGQDARLLLLWTSLSPFYFYYHYDGLRNKRWRKLGLG